MTQRAVALARVIASTRGCRATLARQGHVTESALVALNARGESSARSVRTAWARLVKSGSLHAHVAIWADAINWGWRNFSRRAVEPSRTDTRNIGLTCCGAVEAGQAEFTLGDGAQSQGVTESTCWARRVSRGSRGAVAPHRANAASWHRRGGSVGPTNAIVTTGAVRSGRCHARKRAMDSRRTCLAR